MLNNSLDPSGPDTGFGRKFFREVNDERAALRQELAAELNSADSEASGATESYLKLGGDANTLLIILLRTACKNFIANPESCCSALADKLPGVMILTILLAVILMQLL